MYEDYVNDILDVNNYKNLLAEYQEEQSIIDEEIFTMQKELKSSEISKNNIEMFRKKVMEFADFKALNSSMVDQLIERIEVCHKKIVNNEEVREIHIVYRFIGSF